MTPTYPNKLPWLDQLSKPLLNHTTCLSINLTHHHRLLINHHEPLRAAEHCTQTPLLTSIYPLLPPHGDQCISVIRINH